MPDNPKLLRPDEIEREEPDRFVGYEREMNALIALSTQVSLGPLEKEGVLLFGLPGSGKSFFVETFLRRLNEFQTQLEEVEHLKEVEQLEDSKRLAFHFLRIDATSLNYERDVEQIGETVRRMGEDFIEQNVPMIIMVDEFDAIAPAREINPERQPLVGTIMGFQNSLPSRTVVLWVTNHPANADGAVRNRLTNTLYFDVPDIDLATSLFREAGFTDPEAVVKLLYHHATKCRERYSIRTLVWAIRKVLRMNEGAVSMPSEEVWQDIAAACQGISTKDVDDYRTKYASGIEKSEFFLNVWCREFDVLNKKIRESNG